MENHPYKIDESDVMTRIIECKKSSAIFKESAHSWGNCINSKLGDRHIMHCKSGSFEQYLNQLYSTDQIAMVWFYENHH
jgi:hypothetical protein